MHIQANVQMFNDVACIYTHTDLQRDTCVYTKNINIKHALHHSLAFTNFHLLSVMTKFLLLINDDYRFRSDPIKVLPMFSMHIQGLTLLQAEQACTLQGKWLFMKKTFIFSLIAIILNTWTMWITILWKLPLEITTVEFPLRLDGPNCSSCRNGFTGSKCTECKRGHLCMSCKTCEHYCPKQAVCEELMSGHVNCTCLPRYVGT